MTQRSKSMTAGAARRPAVATVSAGYAGALLDFAAARGADRQALLARSGVEPDDLSDQDMRLPLAAYMTIMRAAKEMCGDPALALAFGAESDIRSFSVVGLIAHAAPTMAEALRQLNRYGQLAVEVDLPADTPRYQIVHENGERWMLDRRADPDIYPELTEATWSRFICWTRTAFPGATYALAAEVTHAPPAHRDAYERIWQVPVAFSAGRNAIRSSPDWGEVAVAPEARYVFGIFTGRGDALLKELQATRTMRGRVEAALMPLLHTGDIRMDQVAKALHTTRPTLYRTLRAEGVSFEAVLDDLRRRMALEYLATRRVSVNETAYLVGFSEPSAFSRAFKRWTGQPPRAVRAASSRP